MAARVRLRPLLFSGMLATGAALAVARAQAPVAPAPPAAELPSCEKLKGCDPGDSSARRVIVLPIEGTIELGLAAFVERVVSGARPEDVVVLDVRTLGGRVDAAISIRDALLETQSVTVAVVHRAISAGALISLATDTIIMLPGASIGAATPVQLGQGGDAQPTSEKVVSYMRAEMGATADANGRRRDVAEAMVDPDVVIEGVIEKGKVLTLTTARALELGMAEAEAASLEQAIALLRLDDAERVRTETDWAETASRFLTDPVVSSLLMTLGFLGLMAELMSPGFGIPGIVGITCLVLFFLGQYVSRLAGAEELLLFLIGLALLALELLVIPGFGVAGIAGILCVVAALGMAMVELELPWDVSFDLGYLQEAARIVITRVGVASLLIGIGIVILFRYLPDSAMASFLVFKPKAAGGGPDPHAGLGAEAPGASLPKSYRHMVGKRGRAETVLRPSGKAVIDGERLDVLTDGQWVDAGTEVEVVRVDGARIVVAAVPGSPPSGSAPPA